ncbi:MAG: hypothetical protein P8Y23_09100 [Candidatus Lokiarchaeota archaeon]|jgi:hypothetical protein
MKQNSKNNGLVFFNRALEYFDYPVDQLSEDTIKSQKVFDLRESDFLRDEMLSELDHLKEVIINNPDKKIAALNDSEKESFMEFVRTFSVCPICGNQNHYFHLKKLYFSDNNRKMKESLLHLMKLKHHKIKFNYGISCCNCFKKHFQDKQNL